MRLDFVGQDTNNPSIQIIPETVKESMDIAALISKIPDGFKPKPVIGQSWPKDSIMACIIGVKDLRKENPNE